jgi:hypothetical protein
VSRNGQGSQVRVEILQNGRVVGSKSINHWSVGGKEGFPMAVVVDSSLTYRLSRDGGSIPNDWIVEFSDTIMTNRFGLEQINLEVVGRTCGIVTSQHDRRFITGGLGRDYRQFGRGACSGHPDMPRVQCDSAPASPFPLLPECPDMCPSGGCNNGFCDCGTGQCKCHPGFHGPSCEVDMCGAAQCGEFGTCATKYLGGELPVEPEHQCDCTPPYAGLTCEANPCPANACNGHGICIGVTEDSFRCECELGFSGPQCEVSCNDVCSGTFPYGCNTSLEPAFCGRGGGCWYDEGGFADPNWCCINGCDDPSSGPVPSPPSQSPPGSPTPASPTLAPPSPTPVPPPSPTSPPPTSPPSSPPTSRCSGVGCPCPVSGSGWNNACSTAPGVAYCPSNGGCYNGNPGCPDLCPPYQP